MNLLRPSRIIKLEDDQALNFRASKMYPYTITDNGIIINKEAHVLYRGEPAEDGWTYVGVPDYNMSQIEFDYYNRFQILINHAANAGETVNVRLRNLLCRIVDDGEICQLISKLSFAKLKGALSDFFHSFTPMKNRENYNTKSKRSAVTKVFNDFIQDRNIYTHGQLFILKPSNEYIIRFLDVSKGIDVEAVIDEQILQSYLNVSDKLILFLNEVYENYAQTPINRNKLVSYVVNNQGKL